MIYYYMALLFLAPIGIVTYLYRTNKISEASWFSLVILFIISSMVITPIYAEYPVNGYVSNDNLVILYHTTGSTTALYDSGLRVDKYVELYLPGKIVDKRIEKIQFEASRVTINSKTYPIEKVGKIYKLYVSSRPDSFTIDGEVFTYNQNILITRTLEAEIATMFILTVGTLVILSLTTLLTQNKTEKNIPTLQK